jgi:nicotinate-nucleotide pyrophosphorylase (carboxylating)
MSVIAPVEPSVLREAAQRVLHDEPAPRSHTTLAVQNGECEARLVLGNVGVLCGLDAAAAVFEAVDPSVAFQPLAWDGAPIGKTGTPVAVVHGSAASLLAAEHAVVSLVGRLSGIATHTRHYVDAVKHTRALILDPSSPHTELQALERYAVRCGGGHTRRPHLLEPVLITRNHVHLAGGIPAAVEYAREQLTAPLPIQLEAYTQDEARGGLDAKVDALLLHDMPTKSINQVVSRAPDTVWLEATGPFTPRNIKPVAHTGVHAISLPTITHTAASVEAGLTFV